MEQNKFKPGDWVYKMAGVYAPYIGIVYSCDGECLRGTRIVTTSVLPSYTPSYTGVTGWESPKFYRLCTPTEIVSARLGLFPVVGSKHE